MSIREDFDNLEQYLWRNITDLSTDLREDFNQLEQDIRYKAVEEARKGIEEEVSRQLAAARVYVFDVRPTLNLDTDQG